MIGLSSRSAVASGLEKELVILFDVSQSMEMNDPERMAADGIIQLLGSLTSDYKAGIIVFNSEIIYEAPLPLFGEDSAKKLRSIKYAGYTNTGIALAKGLSMFSNTASERIIILITDGEISMPTKGETDVSKRLFEESLKSAAESDVVIHTIGIGKEFWGYDTSITVASETTGGRLYEIESAHMLFDVIQDIAFNDLGIKKTSVGTAQASGKTNRFNITVPVTGPDTAKVIITSDSKIEDVSVSFNGAGCEVIRGERCAIITLEKPASNELVIDFITSGAGNLKADLITEYKTGALKTGITYEDETDGQGAVSHTAVINLWLENESGMNIFNSPYFEGKIVPVTISGITDHAPIQNGLIKLRQTVLEDENISLAMAADSIDTNILFSVNAEISLTGPTLPALVLPDVDYRPLLIILSLLGLAIIITVLYHKKKPNPQAPPPLLFDSKHSFSGKLNLYVTKTKDGEEIPPQSFALYRVHNKSEITLQEILSLCRIPNEFPGTDKIYLVAGKNHDLDLVNDSECTVLAGRDILIKKHGRSMGYGEKIHVTCEDEITAMELHYRKV